MGSQISTREPRPLVPSSPDLLSNCQLTIPPNLAMPAAPAMAQPAAAPAAAEKPKVRLPPGRRTRSVPRKQHAETDECWHKTIALLRVQGREVEAGRVHAVLERRGPGQGLPVDDRPIPDVHEGLRLRDMI